MLDEESLANSAVEVDRMGVVDGYRAWSATYDEVPNAAFDFDGPVLEIIEALPTGVALDAGPSRPWFPTRRRLPTREFRPRSSGTSNWTTADPLATPSTLLIRFRPGDERTFEPCPRGEHLGRMLNSCLGVTSSWEFSAGSCSA
ncbi:hypothetical protein [Saccharopolyspora spinosa]|uniref:Uncharacterized protein n=1 Tax=Saccharopolyspora spinosa TaxID=60894 RepID=A0A2N3Y253_SACSN|nr:hypothetical protein [Saccharopolyspora spinosa]PKW16999.1 hypothetical protein A8926_4914 [Saccharopolyspora spinosa]